VKVNVVQNKPKVKSKVMLNYEKAQASLAITKTSGEENKRLLKFKNEISRRENLIDIHDFISNKFLSSE
jgi:hypothetical protein